MRTLAEFEEQEAIVLAYPYIGSYWEKIDSLAEVIETYNEMIRIFSEYTKCIVLYHSESYINTFLKIKSDNVILVQADYDDTWCRDTLPFTLKDKEHTILKDFTFNGWGEKYEFKKDAKLSGEISHIFKRELIKVDFILEGGSIDFNGEGSALVTSSCLLNENRNNIEKTEIEEKLKEEFNLENIIWLEAGDIIGDDTDGHIDMLARFINANTIVYASCDDSSDKNYKSLLDMKENLIEVCGDEYNLIPLPIPKASYYKGSRLPASYINFVFLNNAIIVPTFNDKKSDHNTIKILKKLFKDRSIIPINSTILARGGGSIHCATRNFFNDSIVI